MKIALKQRDRRALMLGLAVLGPPLLYIAAIRPYMDAFIGARERVATEREALARERALLVAAPESTALRHAIDSVVAATEERLFNAPDDGLAAADLVAYVARVARENEVWLQAADAREPVVSPSGMRALAVEIRAESDFRGMLTFLRSLEQGAKLIQVSRVNIVPGTDTSASLHALEMRATVTGYALGDPPAPMKPKPASRGRS